MKTFYNHLHAQHQGKVEMFRGALVPCFEVPARADHVLANSDFTRDTLVSLIGVRPEHIVMTYPTVDTDRYRPGLPYEDLRAGIGLAPAQPLVLSVGRLQRRKGFDQVIRALPELVRRGHDLHYAIVGIGDDWDHLQSLAREQGVSDRLHLLGHVDPADLPRWYNACALFAMPNRDIEGDTEGFQPRKAAWYRRRLKAEGKSFREIEDETGISKSRAHRMLSVAK